MRAHMILLSNRGHAPSKIADLHDVSHPTVYKWIDRFDEEGPEGQTDTSVMTGNERGVRRSSANSNPFGAQKQTTRGPCTERSI